METILLRLLENIIKDEKEAKYRKLRISNKKIATVLDHPRGRDSLNKIGWVEDETGEFVVLPVLEGDAARAQMSLIAAVAAEIRAEAAQGTVEAAAVQPIEEEKPSTAVSPLNSEEPPTLFDVVVVGAGAAGIGAALALERAGLTVCLLEARQNAGGRARALDVLHMGVPVDLGAQWVHSACDGNPMVQLAPQVGIPLVEECDGSVELHDEVRGWLKEDGFGHISTFGGAELGCIVAMKTLEIVQRPEVKSMVQYISDFLRVGLNQIMDSFSDFFIGIRQHGVIMGLEFNHEQGAKIVMKNLYENGVWAIFSTLDPRVLQFKPGLLLTQSDAEDVLRRLAIAVELSREEAFKNKRNFI